MNSVTKHGRGLDKHRAPGIYVSLAQTLHPGPWRDHRHIANRTNAGCHTS